MSTASIVAACFACLCIGFGIGHTVAIRWAIKQLKETFK